MIRRGRKLLSESSCRYGYPRSNESGQGQSSRLPASPAVRGRTLVAGLLSATALVLVVSAGPVQAQSTIVDNGAVVSVPDTHPSPWPQYNYDQLIIGYFDVGMVRVLAGGEVSSVNSYLGFNGSATGTVTVSGDGALWRSSGQIVVGYQGVGELTVSDSGTVINGTSGAFIASNHANASGTVTVSGAGSSWQSAGNFTIGGSGKGVLNIEAGGVVASYNGVIGSAGSGRGTVTVSDASWQNAAALYVGYVGTGALTIDAGGTVSNTAGYIGYAANSSGAVTVAGPGASWQNSDLLYVGGAGDGALTIGAGGTVSNTLGIIGAGASGATTVSGAGASWQNSDALYVGYVSNGALTIGEGGVVRAGGGAGAVIIGDLAGSTGAVTIGAGFDADGNPLDAVAAGTLDATSVAFRAGAGRLAFNHSGNPDGSDHVFAPAIQSGAGTASINQIAGTTVLTGNSSVFAGTTTVSGGTLIVANALGGAASVTGGSLVVDGTFGGTVVASTGGVVSGAGTIAGNGDFTGGGVLAGSQGQTLSIAGNVLMDATSVVNVALGGAPSDALFDVGGNLTLIGTLNIVDQGGFGAGIYRLFDYGGVLTGDGMAIGTRPDGVAAGSIAIQTSVANQVNLVSAAGSALGFWDGGNAALHDNGAIDGGAGTWRADGRNWTGADGSFNGPFLPNPTFAVFQTTGGLVTLDASAGAIGITGMQFTADGYAIDGDVITLEGPDGQTPIRVGDGTLGGAGLTATIASPLSGASALVKHDHGTLILMGSNSYSGGTRINAGVLSISSDLNLGASTGGLTFGGGTLAATASFDTGRAIMLDMAGRFDVAAGVTLGLDGVVGGWEDLIKLGDGTLVLTGSNTFGGNTVVEAGTLVGNASSIRGNIASAGTVVFDQGADGVFVGDIGGLNGEMVKRGAGILTLDGTSTLDWSVEIGGLATAAQRFSGDADIRAGAALTFTQSDNAAYGGVLSGAGGFALSGTGTVMLTGDSSAFMGATTVGPGSGLIVGAASGGALGGSVTVAAGGLLGGTGTIGSAGGAVTVAPGGVHAPGDSIGVQTIAGDYVNHGVLRIEMAPDAADRIVVAGSVDITGATLDLVLLSPGASNWDAFNGPFVIINKQSAGAVVGSFDSMMQDRLFFDVILDYAGGDGNDVTLALERNGLDFADVGRTRNQIAAASGVDTLDADHDVWRSVALTNDEDIVRASFDALSGEIHGSVRTGLIEDSRFIRSIANDRLRATAGAVGASTAPVLAYGPGQVPTLVPADHSDPVFWANGFGSWGSTASDGNAASLDRSTGGLLLGADGLAGDWRLGLLAGYSQSRVQARARLSSASTDSYHLGLYAGTKWGNVAFRTGAAYSWHDIATTRVIAIPGIGESLTASYGASTLQTFGELGYSIDAGPFRFEPFANLAHVGLNSGGFAETGGVAAIAGKGEGTDVTFTTLGVRADYALAHGMIDATFSGMLGWRHALGDVAPENTHAFASSGPFTIAGAPIAHDSAVVEAGLNVNFSPDATLGLSYSGQIAAEGQDHGFRASLNIRF